nr:PREDICTED: X-linked retinitis pigmentosa GTPase regulator-interacting protein 1 [Anolis carolinensis]|eukprot:XP_016852796.1 PREDICTED: X-linked retinitis pigmentosa GTPase regulator-interacting protein 1 [Anolis carolinensis]
MGLDHAQLCNFVFVLGPIPSYLNMSLLLLDETAGDLPVRDTNQKPSVIAAIQDVSSSAVIPVKPPVLKSLLKGSRSLARTRRQIARVTRTELEDGFLRLHDENLLLKEFARKQEDRIKRMGTKLSRLSHERAQLDGRPGSWVRSTGRNLDLEEDLEEMQERVRELERHNEGLRNRLLFYKQQLQLQGCGRHCPYSYVTPRVNTGLRRANTAVGRVPERLAKGMRMQGPVARPTHTAPPRYGDHVLEGSRAEMERLSHHSLVLAELGLDRESTSPLGKATDPESTHYQQRHEEVQERRAAIQDNVELIRLQKLLRTKNSELVLTKAQFAGLQEAYETHLQQNQDALRSTSEALLAQVEELNAHLKEETQKVTALESQLEILSPLQGTLKDFQERVQDLETERDLLKMDYDKLLESCMTTAQQNVDEVPQKDNAPCPEAQLILVTAEKKKLEEQLEKEIAHNEELKHEVSLLLTTAQEVGSPQEKSTIVENPSREEEPHSHQIQPLILEGEMEISMEKEEVFSQQSLNRKLHETEAAHAETALELEKTRDMLILQHRINRDYQAELEGVLLQANREKQEREEKQENMAQLLDLRSSRIRQLEEQLKDIAYGTRAVPFRMGEVDASLGTDPDKAPQLRRGENLFELHISGAVLSAEAQRFLGDAEPATFCTYSFYDFETHCTPVVRGIRPRYDFTSQYVVRAEPFFLQYLQEAACRLELHLASAVDHATLASCRLRFGEALGTGEQVHATAVLHGANGADYGLLEYWVRFRFPIEETLRLHHQRTKALGYLSAGVPRSTAVQLHWQKEGAQGTNRNEVRVRIEGCAGLRSRWLGSQPSPYAMYQFFTFPDHDTVIIPASNNPHFGDLQPFVVRVTPELHHYLLVESLWVYVFDDEDEEPGNYLGKAQIPLLPLANGRSISGDFVLLDPAGKPNGSICLSLEWSLLYVPPEEAGVLKPTDLKPMEQQIETKQARLRNQVLLEEIREEGEEILALEEEAAARNQRGSDAGSSMEAEAGMSKKPASEEVESDAPTTESDEVVMALSSLQEPLQPEPSDRIRLEIISLSLLPESEPVADEHIQQLYVEYHFPGVLLEETETPFSLRKPEGDQEIYFHFSKVIRLDPNPASLQRQLLFSMLEAEEPEWNQLRFVVVSEPLPGAGGDCEEVGFAYLDLREILLTGCDVLERELWVVSSLDLETYVGKLKVSIEAAAVLRAVYWAGKSKKTEER